MQPHKLHDAWDGLAVLPPGGAISADSDGGCHPALLAACFSTKQDL